MIIRLLVIAYLCTLPLYWFGNDEYIDGVTGLSYLVNDPAVLIGAVLMAVGLFKSRSFAFTLAGSAVSLAGLIVSFLRWPVPHLTGSMDIFLSMEMTFTGFYVSFGLLLVTAAVCAFCLHAGRRAAK